MKSCKVSAHALSVGVAVAFLAGCGALRQAQDYTQLPIGLPTDAVAHRVGTALSSYRVLYSFGATSNDGLRP